ncbi:hypothetical protein H8356DRAFT_1335167 [Neocallimastix lanati (nom. inval.)]|nr:hypothetical protein H8356DRAFT_1335167 [Neocallimastix sp. JGI-2020a]
MKSKFSNSIVISPINFYCDLEKRHIKCTLKKEETLSTDEIKALIECYKNKEEKLIYIGYDDDDRVELWYDCLIHLNTIKY